MLDFTYLTRSELETLKKDIILTEDEEIVFDMLAKGKSIRQIADRAQMCTRSVDRRIKNIKKKIRNYKSVVK